MDWIDSGLDRWPNAERGPAGVVLRDIRRSHPPAHPTGHRRSIAARTRSRHSDPDRFWPDQTCRRIRQGQRRAERRFVSIQRPQRGYLGASTPPLRFMLRVPHENAAPSLRIIGMKSGKLVAMKLVSSTLTGWSEASPITSADMAIR